MCRKEVAFLGGPEFEQMLVTGVCVKLPAIIDKFEG